MNHLPLLSQLFNTTPSSAPIGSTDRTEFLVGVLGTIMGTLDHIGFVQWWSNLVIRFGIRKVQVRGQVKMSINTALSHIFTPAAISTLQNSIAKIAKQTKQEIKQTKQESKNLSLVTLSRLSAFTGTINAAPDDLTMPADASVAHSAGWTRGGLQENRKLHANRQREETGRRGAQPQRYCRASIPKTNMMKRTKRMKGQMNTSNRLQYAQLGLPVLMAWQLPSSFLAQSKQHLWSCPRRIPQQLPLSPRLHILRQLLSSLPLRIL